MEIIKISEGQTLIDIAIQYLGDASLIFELAEINNIEITENLIPGTSLLIIKPNIDKTKMIAQFKANKTIPASALEEGNNFIPEDWDVFYGLYD